MGSLALVQRAQHSCICCEVPQPIKFLDAAHQYKISGFLEEDFHADFGILTDVKNTNTSLVIL
jgi:hypothetical protein